MSVNQPSDAGRFALPRNNQTLPRSESWRPPLLTSPTTRQGRIVAWLRHWLDLQAGSIWADMSMLLPHAGGTVVDIGAGAQPYRSLLPGGVRYLAVDIATSEQDFGYAVPGTVLYSGDTWPVGSESADVILCTETLEHVFDSDRFIREAHRVLKPGGHLIGTVPFAARWHFIPNDFWRFTPSSLARLLEERGFSAVRVYARGGSATVACSKVMALMTPLLGRQVGSRARRAWRLSLLVLALPILAVLSLWGNITLRFPKGDDCLGYTFIASRDGVPSGRAHDFSTGGAQE